MRESEERFRALVEGKPEELSSVAARLQAQRIESLMTSRSDLVDRIKLLCQQLPPGSWLLGSRLLGSWSPCAQPTRAQRLLSAAS